MTVELLRQALENGAECIYAYRAGESDSVRGGFSLTFDRRKGFHSVERSLKQIARTAAKNGILLLEFRDTCIVPASRECGEEIITAFPDDRAEQENLLRNLPKYDLTSRVRMQKMLHKIGFF